MSNTKDLYERILAKDPDYVDKYKEMFETKPINFIETLTLEQFMQIETPPLEFICTPILPVQGICIIYAAQGLGKTLFTLNLAYSIAMGGQFLKYKSAIPKRVLYVDAEMAANQLKKRLTVIIESQGNLDIGDNFHLITPDLIRPHHIPQIDKEEGQQFYAHLIKQKQIDVIVFDNLSMLASIDENKSHEWKPIQDWLLSLKSLGASIILVHHAGKDKGGYRGTSRMMDAPNTAISLQPLTEDEMAEDEVKCKKFKVKYEKHRDFDGDDALPFEVNLSFNQWTFKAIELSQMDKILARYEMGMKQLAIAKDMNVTPPYINKMLKKARDLKLIKDE